MQKPSYVTLSCIMKHIYIHIYTYIYTFNRYVSVLIYQKSITKRLVNLKMVSQFDLKNTT